MKAPASQTRISLPDFCRERGISKRVALGWIEAGELAAIDYRAVGAKRPRLFIAREAIDAFEESRRVGPHKPRMTEARRQKGAEQKNYF